MVINNVSNNYHYATWWYSICPRISAEAAAQQKYKNQKKQDKEEEIKEIASGQNSISIFA